MVGTFECFLVNPNDQRGDGSVTVDEVKTCEIRIGKLRVEKYLGAEEPLVAHIDSEPALCDAVDSLILLDVLVGVLVKPGNDELSLILGRN